MARKVAIYLLVIVSVIIVLLMWRRLNFDKLLTVLHKKSSEDLKMERNFNAQSIVECSDSCLPCSTEKKTCANVLAIAYTMGGNTTNPNKKRTFKRKVVMSSDTMNLFYAWFAPITSLVWYAQSWTPVFIFAESETVSTSLQVFEFIVKQVEEAGGK